jgi:hypothetical protein
MSDPYIKDDAFSDRLTQALELASMRKPPEEEAVFMMTLFSENAIYLAEKCIDMMGEIGSEESTDYWRKVYGYIKLHSVRH